MSFWDLVEPIWLSRDGSDEQKPVDSPQPAPRGFEFSAVSGFVDGL